MFNEKYTLDAVVAFFVLLISIGVWGNDKMKGLVKVIILGVLLVPLLLWINSRHGFLQGSSSTAQVIDGAKVTGKGFISKIPWLRIFLAVLLGFLTFWYAKRVALPKPWLADRSVTPTEPTPTPSAKGKSAPSTNNAKPALIGKQDVAAYWATNVCGYFCALAVLLAGSIWSLFAFVVAVAAEVSIMNVQVPEQERWTPLMFGKRCFGHLKGNEWMLGNYCFVSGWNWMLRPRNWPGLSFNVAKPRQGISIACKTSKVPTLGYKVGDVDVTGGEVEVEFSLLYDSHDDLDAYYSSQDDIRNDPAKLAAYASDIFQPEFRRLLKGKSLAEIQGGDIFDGCNFKESIDLFERGTGHLVTKCRVKDPTPSEEVQKQINALAAKQIEKVQAGLDAEIAVIRSEAIGQGHLSELKPLMDALSKPNTSVAVREAIQAVARMDFAKHSQLRVLVEKELGSLAPLVAEASED